MKGTILLTIIILNSLLLRAQNVGIGTSLPIAKLHIKGSQDSSQLVIDANSTQSYNHPLIRLRKSDGTDLLAISADDSSNIFMGVGAGYHNLSTPGLGNVFVGVHAGSANIAISNTGIGEEALKHNTTGRANVAVGSESMWTNTDGYLDVAVGRMALANNTTGFNNTGLGGFVFYENSTGSNNTAVGAYAAQSNSTGEFNTMAGSYALSFTTTGSYNTALGYQTLFNNGAGAYNTALGANAMFSGTGDLDDYNTAIGYQALTGTTNSQYNTAVGYNAGSYWDNGYNNVFLGANADVNGRGYYNVIAIGQATVCTAPSQVTIGNPATDTYRAYANWSNISDGRFKKNVRENVPGLDFITKLHPVTYNLNATGLDAFLHPDKDNTPAATTLKAGKAAASGRPADEKATANYTKALQEKETQTITGFVAQDVESAAKSLGYSFSGVQAPKNDGDVYSLRYAEFVAPLVKAVQEQQAMIADLRKEVETLKTKLSVLEEKK
jgi:hypothetical protein